jgi:hypothetical protein
MPLGVEVLAEIERRQCEGLSLMPRVPRKT